MMKLKKGDVGFLMHHDNFLSKVLAWFMKSRWSHSFIVLEIADKTYLCETSDFQVVVGTLERYLDDPNTEIEVWSPKNATDTERDRIVNGSFSQHEVTYGYFQLISLGIRRLLLRIKIRIRNFFRCGVVCNQVLLYGYRLSSIPTLSGIDPKSIDTEETYQLMINSGFFVKVLEKGVNK